MDQAAHILPFPERGGQAGENPWITRYRQEKLVLKDSQTVEAYNRIILDFVKWLPRQAGGDGSFHPSAITANAVKTYFSAKKKERRKPTQAESQLIDASQLREEDLPARYAPTSLARMKVALTGFVEWLIAQEQLYWNPVKEIVIPKMAARPPRVLTPAQRYTLRDVVERTTAPQGQSA